MSFGQITMQTGMATATVNIAALCPRSNASILQKPRLSLLPSLYYSRPKSKVCCTNTTPSSTCVSVEDKRYEKSGKDEEKFDWYSEWYAVAPVCDLDKKVPHGKKIMGIDVVIWWDSNNKEWRVFDDACPHRLSPLSEGRIDAWGRLQCVYHGWCFNGSGSCKLIPQAPPDGPPVHTSKKACVASYPCTVQHDILWFWPNSDPDYRDILAQKQPPYIPELDDPSYTRSMGLRDFPHGYEVLVENLMDPAHLQYAHYGIMPPAPADKTRPNADREGGRPMDITVQKVGKTGFSGTLEGGYYKFMPPGVYYLGPHISESNEITRSSQEQSFFDTFLPKAVTSTRVSEEKQKRRLLVFICIPVSPGKCRALWVFPRNFMLWIDNVVPRWMFHLVYNRVFDSDMYLLHCEEQSMMRIKGNNWQKAFYVPTKSDLIVVAFRQWLNKYAGGGVDWRNKYDATLLPPTPRRDVLFDRYWTHVVNCTSCSAAYKWLKRTQTLLEIFSVALTVAVALLRQSTLTNFQRTSLCTIALICFVTSKWLSSFVYKHFHFHDYKHALV